MSTAPATSIAPVRYRWRMVLKPQSCSYCRRTDRRASRRTGSVRYEQQHRAERGVHRLPAHAVRRLALANAYDAMCTERVYNPALPQEQVIGRIMPERGARFAPDVVDCFVHLAARFGEIAATTADGTERPPEQSSRRSEMALHTYTPYRAAGAASKRRRVALLSGGI